MTPKGRTTKNFLVASNTYGRMNSNMGRYQTRQIFVDFMKRNPPIDVMAQNGWWAVEVPNPGAKTMIINYLQHIADPNVHPRGPVKQTLVTQGPLIIEKVLGAESYKFRMALTDNHLVSGIHSFIRECLTNSTPAKRRTVVEFKKDVIRLD